ncbi:Lipid-A-disaccharide synthase [BD1-7 clade bacterium]|uniref:Lipid-A-disaccharide synthase n=1 Tax=BD1-7 clade bacterium TaxID=2029982 RepID=A0A5S9QCV2_9GAMM|nr:Lipid-A-disaccharide synthase [BD1-7 clade bacterium]
MRIVIVAGEASGDTLGAGLISALRKEYTSGNPSLELEFCGIGGPKMCALGFQTFFDMERLSVMGLVEPAKRLPELLHIRRTIRQYCVQHDVDLFIGIDSPDFNLPIEKYLRKRGIKTAHYVSPSVWAWRQGRIRGIKKSVDLMLTLLPFEAEFYQAHDVPVAFIGHPLGDDIPMEPDQVAARKRLNLPEKGRMLAILPGSRGGEVRMLGELFLEVAKHVHQKDEDCIYLIPAANNDRKEQLQAFLEVLNEDPSNQRLVSCVRLFDGQSHDVMAASDAVLLASGTTALEAMLLKKPMVVAYRLAPLSYAIVSRLVKSPYVSLPNLLANKMLVPEILQDAATSSRLADEIWQALTNSTYRSRQIDAFYSLHETIACDASAKAAKAIKQLTSSA